MDFTAETGEIPPVWLPGSAVMVSGGYFAPDYQGVLDRQSPDVYMYGCLDMAGREGNRIAEKVVGDMVPPAARVTMMLYVSRPQAGAGLEALRAGGFRVIVTGDVRKGVDSQFAVCQGTGEMIRGVRWLEEVWGFDPFFALATSGPPSRLEDALVSAARRNDDPDMALWLALKDIQRRPRTTVDWLGEHYLFVRLEDPDQRSLWVCRSVSDTASVEPLLVEAGRAHHLPVFDGGSPSERSWRGHRFVDRENWDTWLPLPAHWRKVV